MRDSVVTALLLALVACSSNGTTGDTCSRSSDCAADLDCAGPNDFTGCGIAPQHQCSASTDCAAGEMCHAIYDACSSSGVGSHCGPACTATSCDAGFRCNASGACEPVPCDAANPCAAPRVCDASTAAGTGPVFTETDGCVVIACTGDGDCTANEACVNGTCQTGPGSCKRAVAIP
ncbi:MAG: hypothetical protein ABI467_07470 [Kofleriaceae bacterium]